MHRSTGPDPGNDHRNFPQYALRHPIGKVGTSLVDVEAVVLDECHYMNDRSGARFGKNQSSTAEIQLVALCNHCQQ